jgi:hypothetical protein
MDQKKLSQILKSKQVTIKVLSEEELDARIAESKKMLKDA